MTRKLSHEQSIAAAILESGIGWAYVVKTTTGPGGRRHKKRGHADVMGYVNWVDGNWQRPVPLFVEAKLGNDRPSQEQIAFLDKREDDGCCCILAHDLTGGEVVELIQRWVKLRMSWRTRFDGKVRK